MTRRAVARAGIAALALLTPLLPVSSAAPASSKARPVLVYDALGDSYASGYGVPPYETLPCARSDAAYAVQVDGRIRIDLDDFVACAGATTTSLIAGGQLDALDADTDLVTISIGGNDIRWGQVVGACLLDVDAACTAATASTRTLVTDALPGLLRTVYDQVAARAPHATVLVTGYPRLFSPEYGSPYFRASVDEQEALNEGADLLNATISAVAADYGFTFVDVTRRFAGHGVNAPDPWILPFEDAGRFHPDVDGYEAYAAAVTAAVKPGRRP